MSPDVVGSPDGGAAGVRGLDRLLRELGPRALAALVRRGADFADAEDAVQEALLEASRRWPQGRPDDPAAWLVTVAWRRFLDARRSADARTLREGRFVREEVAAPVEQADDTLLLLSRCCHEALSPASAVALTLRAVGGLTTAQVAGAFLVPEATMAQRISRAKRTVAGQGFERPGEIGAVLKVLYVMFSEGHTGEDRSRWDTAAIAEGVGILQGALAQDQPGEYQVQAAIAALHDDAASAAETDWPQILEWYDELLQLAPSPVVALNRAVAVGEVDGARAGLAVLADLDPALPRYDAVAAHLLERAGDLAAADRYALAADRAVTVPERAHLTQQAARVRERGHG